MSNKIQKKDKNSDAIDTDSDSSHEMADILRPKKKAKWCHLSTITLGYLHNKEEKYEDKTYEKNKNSIFTLAMVQQWLTIAWSQNKTEAGKALQLEY